MYLLYQIWVAVLGILCIGLTLMATGGLASYLNLPYGPVHSVIPFLLLGNYVLYSVCAWVHGCMHVCCVVCACVHACVTVCMLMLTIFVR